MTTHSTEKLALKQKLAHEFKEMAGIFLYLACFLCALATYSTLLLDEFHVSYFAYSTALLNALIMSKVIMLGEIAHVGRKHETKPLFFTALIKALLFSLLMAAFHVIEEIIKHLLHGHTVAAAFRDFVDGRLVEILARNLVFFCALVPFFAFRELRRVLGKEKHADLFFRKGAAALTDENLP